MRTEELEVGKVYLYSYKGKVKLLEKGLPRSVGYVHTNKTQRRGVVVEVLDERRADCGEQVRGNARDLKLWTEQQEQRYQAELQGTQDFHELSVRARELGVYVRRDSISSRGVLSITIDAEELGKLLTMAEGN